MCLTRDIFTRSISGELPVWLGGAASRRGAGAPAARSRPPGQDIWCWGIPPPRCAMGLWLCAHPCCPRSSQEPRQARGAEISGRARAANCHHPLHASNGWVYSWPQTSLLITKAQADLWHTEKATSSVWGCSEVPQHILTKKWPPENVPQKALRCSRTALKSTAFGGQKNGPQ